MLELKNLSSGYGKNCIIRNVSAEFKKGELCCMIGKNGCGKSTLLKTVVGILPAQSGSITADGADISTLSPRSVARLIAYLAQGRSVPDMTVGQMVLHGRFAHLGYPRVYKEHDRKIAVDAMKRMGIYELEAQKMASLSGGMRQNAYIAMALAQSADYILLDEPTTYLDVANQIRLMDTLRDIAKSGKGIIAVLHDIPLAMRFADRVVVLENGNIIANGTPEEIFSSDIITSVFGVSLAQSKKENGFSYFYEY